jgi:hypothetical protein
MKKIITVVFGIILLSFSPVFAQTPLEVNIENILQDPQKGEPYFLGYIQPLTTGSGILMGSGLFHRASVKAFPHLDIGLTYIHIILPEPSKMFYYQGQNLPSVFGNAAPAQGIVPGTGLSFLSLPLLHLNLGLTEEFELMLRTSLVYTIPELGEFRISGVGIKYGLSELVTSETFPLDLSVQASYHLLSMNSWFKAGTFAMNIQSSKELPVLPLEIYAGVGYEVTSVTMRTEDIPGIGEFAIGDVKQNGKNGLRLVVGAAINLFFLSLHADYEFGYYNALAGGIKISY